MTCSGATIIPSLPVIFDVLQHEVIQLDNVGILLRKVHYHSKRLKKHTRFRSKLVRGTIYTDDEIPTVHCVTAGVNFAIRHKSS